MNEDVFAQPCAEEQQALHPSIQELTEQIHRLLLQVSAHPQDSPYLVGSLRTALSLNPSGVSLCPAPWCLFSLPLCGRFGKVCARPRQLGTPAACPGWGSPSLALWGLSLTCSLLLMAEGCTQTPAPNLAPKSWVLTPHVASHRGWGPSNSGCCAGTKRDTCHYPWEHSTQGKVRAR